MERQRRAKQHAISNEAASTLQTVVYLTSSKFTEEVDGLEEPFWSVSTDKFVRCVASAGVEAEKTENVRSSRNIISKHVGEVLADLVKERIEDHDSASSFRYVLLCVSRIGFVTGG